MGWRDERGVRNSAAFHSLMRQPRCLDCGLLALVGQTFQPAIPGVIAIQM